MGTLPHSDHDRLIHPKYRPDIDGLRAIAVLAVVCFHTFPRSVRGGFIGVDIFFVISGFLISTILFDNLAATSFSFAAFYSRRIKRIFPALITVLLASCLFGWGWLYADDYKQLGLHVAAGAGFLSNFLLWHESGYFDAAADTKPLLHLWSLGIEEQFYILWPFALWAAWKKRIQLPLLMAAATAASFALNIFEIHSDSVAAFYSPLARFWELASGACLAFMTLYGPRATAWMNLKNKDLQSLLGAALLTLGMVLINRKRLFPGFWAMMPVLGTLLIISAGRDAWFNRKILSNRLLVGVGLISFPLYLWHWPLLVFENLFEGEVPSPAARAIIIVVATFLAWVTYAFIEKPIRFGAPTKTKTLGLVVLMCAVGLTGYACFLAKGYPSRTLNQNQLPGQLGRWDYIQNDFCKNSFGSQLTFCMSSTNKPEIILFGDSHANQLYPGLANLYQREKGVLSIGNGPPLDAVETRHWGTGNRSYLKVIDIIKNNSAIKTVVVAGDWEPLIYGRYYLDADEGSNLQLIDLSGTEQGATQQKIFLDSFAKTIRTLAATRKKIILVINTPELLLDVKKCAYRSSETACSFPKADILQRQSYFRSMSADLLRVYPTIKIFDPVPILCPDATCVMVQDGHLMYRDNSHISAYASGLLAEKLRALIDSK